MTIDQRQLLFIGLLSSESPKYWELCHKTIMHSTSNNTEISYVIGVDRSSKQNIHDLISYVPNCHVVDVSIYPPNRKETVQEKRIRIGTLYNKLFDYIRKDGLTADYGAIIDGDLAFIKTDWDNILINELKDQYIIIGQEYGSEWPLKFQNFPCLNFCLFKFHEIMALNIDSRGNGKPLEITKDNSNIFGLSVGKQLNREIGWRWPLKIKQAGFDGKVLNMIKGSSNKSQILFPRSNEEKKMYKKNKIKALYEMHWNNEIILSHMSKSTCLEFNVHPLSKFWINRISDVCKLNV